MNQESNSTRTKLCQNCRKRIRLGNFEVHIAACGRAEQKNKPQQTRPSAFMLERPNTQKMQSNATNATIERFPCHLCGYQQSLAELDTHNKTCPNREINCTFCNHVYPSNIMNQHKLVCPKRQQSSNGPFVSSRSMATSMNNRPESEEISFRNNIFNRNNVFSSNIFSRYQESRDNVIQRSTHVSRQREQRRINLPVRPLPSREIGERRQFRIENMMEMGRQFHGASFSRMVGIVNRIQSLAEQRQEQNNGGMKSQQIKLIPEKKYIKLKEESDCCSICCCDLEKNDKIKDLTCKHLYHTKCISTWLTKNRLCPLCKKDLSKDAVPKKPRQIKEQKTKGKELLPNFFDDEDLSELDEQFNQNQFSIPSNNSSLSMPNNARSSSNKSINSSSLNNSSRHVSFDSDDQDDQSFNSISQVIRQE